jgi:PAS domain S-box-containing protein
MNDEYGMEALIHVIRHSLDGACLISASTGLVLYANDSALNYLGYTPAVIHTIKFNQLINRLAAGEEPGDWSNYQGYRGEMELLRCDGSVFPVEISIVKWQRQLVIQFRDLSECRLKSETLRKRNAILNFLSESSHLHSEFPYGQINYKLMADRLRGVTGAFAILIQTFDSSTRVTTSEALSIAPEHEAVVAQALGFSPVGRKWEWPGFPVHQSTEIQAFDNPRQLLGVAIPGGLDRIGLQLGKIYVSNLIYREQLLGDIVIIMPERVELEEAGALKIFSQQMAAAVARQKIEQALVDSQALYQSLFEHSGDAVFVTDPSGDLLQINQAACRLLRYGKDELMKFNLRELITHPDPADYHGFSEKGGFLGEVMMNAKDGEEVAVEINTTVLPDGNILGIARDIRERKTAAAAQRAKENAEERDRTRNRFLQIAAHELRNPMAGVKGGLSLLRYRVTAGRPLGDIARIALAMEREIDRLSNLLNAILEAFQIQEGHFPMEFTQLNLIRVIQSALKPFLTGEDASRITLNFSGCRQCWIMGDYFRLENVFRNLLNNALKYSPLKSEVNVDLTVGDGWSILTVRDQGVGIPGDQLDAVFEGFFRATNIERFQDPGGLGLGLYICRDIITKHQGLIWAESEPGQGTSVYVKLPLYQPEEG